MKNLIKITSLTIIAMLVIVGSLMAQDKTETSKSEKKCGSACCSSKKTNAKIDNSKMDHNKMTDIKSIDKNKDGKVFQCPMKCEAPQDESGQCSKCGMNLKEISVKDTEKKFGHAMHKMMDHSKMGHASSSEDGNIDFASIDKNKNRKVYQCPMVCTDSISDEKGECAKCGMNLKEISIKDAKKNLTDHQHKTN